MKAELIQHDHNDLTVVNAARVSFRKQSEVMTVVDERLIQYLAKHRHWTPFGHARYGFHVPGPHRFPYTEAFIEWAGSEAARAGFEWSIRDSQMAIEGSLFGWVDSPPPFDIKVGAAIAAHLRQKAPISFDALADPDMWELSLAVDPPNPCLAIPYESNAKTFRLSMPIFIARQWMRSNIGVVYNEVSRRYVDDAPEFWTPDEWRARPDKSIKQGSGEPLDYTPCYFGRQSDKHTSEDLSEMEYKRRLDQGVAPEMARTCLPQSMMTELWMTATPSALNRIIGLRDGSDGHPQKEIQDLAALVVEAMENES